MEINRTFEITGRKSRTENAVKPWATLVRNDGTAFEIRNDSVDKENCSCHFKTFSIERKEGRIGEDNTSPAVITNTGRKPLFVNKEKLAMNERRILLNGDVIKIKNFKTSFEFLDQRVFGSAVLGRYSETVRKDFFFEKRIGVIGLNGSIQLAHDVRTFERFAVKSISLWKKVVTPEGEISVQDADMAQREIKIMLQLNHPNIVRLVKTVWDQQYAHLFIELMNMGDLFGIVSQSPLSETDTKFVMFQICQGLKYLHDNKIGHGDIKLENIFVKSRYGKIIYKIGDFGLSVFDKNATKRDGTLVYSAPEVFYEGNQVISVRKSDIWSLGVVAYACVSGQFPFTKKDTEQTMMQILVGKISFKDLTEISSNMKHLICRMIVVNPKKRFNVFKVLNHQWFNDSELKDRMDDIDEVLQRDVKNARKSSLRMFNRSIRTY